MPFTFERSLDTEALVTTLHAVNGEIGYDDIAKRAGLSRARVKSLLASARRILSRDNILFGTLRGVGLKRLGDLEKAHLAEATKKRIANTARRGLHDLDTIENFGALPNIEQLTVTTNRTIFHLIREQAKTKAHAEAPAVAPSTRHGETAAKAKGREAA